MVFALLWCTLCYAIVLLLGPLLVEEGDIAVAQVDKVVPGSHMLLRMPNGHGRLDITDTSDHYQPDPFENIGQQGKLIRSVFFLDNHRII